MAQTCWSEETCSQSVKLDDETVEGTTLTQCGDIDVEVGYINLQPLLRGERIMAYAKYAPFPLISCFTIKGRCL